MEPPKEVVQFDAGKCLFLYKLSPELRNNIYELVLVTSGKATQADGKQTTTSVEIITETQPALLRTCRQIRSEGLAMYYHHNIFKFTTTTADATALLPIVKWMKRIGYVVTSGLTYEQGSC
jgi:hypothetical protein